MNGRAAEPKEIDKNLDLKSRGSEFTEFSIKPYDENTAECVRFSCWKGLKPPKDAFYKNGGHSTAVKRSWRLALETEVYLELEFGIVAKFWG